jgi:hypothetical protein
LGWLRCALPQPSERDRPIPCGGEQKESARLQESILKQIKTGNFAAGEALFDNRLGE